MGEDDYYKIRKNYLNMEQENENEVRSDIDAKILNNVMRKHDQPGTEAYKKEALSASLLYGFR